MIRNLVTIFNTSSDVFYSVYVIVENVKLGGNFAKLWIDAALHLATAVRRMTSEVIA